MTLQTFITLLKKHALWFILFPALTAGTIFYLTRNETRTYKSEATLYTGLGSGYSLNSATAGFRVDYTAVSNAFDNIITTLNSKETLAETGKKLLAAHLQLQKPDNRVLSAAGFQKLQLFIPAGLRKSLVRPGNPAFTDLMLDSLLKAETDNPVKSLLFNSPTYYSVEVIRKKLKSSRRSFSDMLDLEYEADDPAVAKQTLDLVIESLNDRYTSIKKKESNPVVNYYEDKVRKAKQNLDAAEARLQAFNVRHKVLNFDEESKNMALTKEALLSEYQQELMRNRAAKAAMEALNNRMGKRSGLLKINTELTDKQAEITEVESQLVNARANNQPTAVLNRLQAKIFQLSEELKVIARNYFAADNSADNVPQGTLINEWLGKVLAFEESAARLDIYRKRLADFDKEAAAFSPLGPQLSQLKRDLSVAEKEYLDVIDRLDQANTQRQDIQIDGSVSVLDAPNFPYVPTASKRWLFVGAGVGVGLFLALFLTALRFVTDQRLSTPDLAESKTGRPVTAVFPVVKKVSLNSRESRAAMTMFEQLCSAINIEMAQSAQKTHPPVITLFSMHAQDGKSWVASSLARVYAESGQKIAYYYPSLKENTQAVEQYGVTYLPYPIRPDFMNLTAVEDLSDEDITVKNAGYDKIFLELPPFVSSPIPVPLLGRTSVGLLVLNARGSWKRTEKQLLSMYLKVSGHPLLTVLNRVESDYIQAPTLKEVKDGPVKPERLTESKNPVPTNA
ncbi:GumC family protein [Larkinella soli]|uniref:GumC family protein n=1 Tax=Larkinella soli TaxID=1770527 RepID=UPI000FFC5885|nr:hypothetical protein [Larkinella soli]